MEAYRLAVTKKEAVIFFLDGTSQAGYFFVSPVSPERDRSEFVSELLMDGRRYVPFERPEGDIILVNKKNIVKVLIKDREEFFTNTTQRAIVRVGFLTGERMTGTIGFSMPETHSRLSDFLNQCQEFFPLETDTGLFLINHGFVKSIIPHNPPFQGPPVG